MNPPIVSNRNHFESADDLVERGMMHLPLQFHVETFRSWLVRYTEDAIRSMASSFGVGAQRGIEQTAHLLCDPKFYETKRKRRNREDLRIKTDIANQEFEREQRRLAPTQEQLDDSIRWHAQQRDYLQKRMDEHDIAIAKLQKLSPSTITIPTQVTQ